MASESAIRHAKCIAERAREVGQSTLSYSEVAFLLGENGVKALKKTFDRRKQSSRFRMALFACTSSVATVRYMYNRHKNRQGEDFKQYMKTEIASLKEKHDFLSRSGEAANKRLQQFDTYFEELAEKVRGMERTRSVDVSRIEIAETDIETLFERIRDIKRGKYADTVSGAGGTTWKSMSEQEKAAYVPKADERKKGYDEAYKQNNEEEDSEKSKVSKVHDAEGKGSVDGDNEEE